MLLVRQPKGLHLTDVGRTVFEYAQRIFVLSDEMRQAILDIQGLRRGHLVIGAGSTPGEFILPIAMGRFRQLYPNITIEPVIGTAPAITQRILDRELDIAILGEIAVADHPEVQTEPYVDDELVVVAPTAHPLASKEWVSPKEVEQEGLIIREYGSSTRRAIERCFSSLGVAPKIIMELHSNQAVKQAVMAGLGLGVASVFAIRAETKAGLMVRLRVEGWHCPRPLVVAYRKDARLSAAQQAFLEMVRKERPLPPLM